MKLYVMLPILFLYGCTSPLPKIVNHDVMVTIPCKITMPVKPVMPLTDTGDIKDNIFIKTKKALAELDIRRGYEAQLEAAAGSCQ